MAGQGRVADFSELDGVFARLDGQQRLEVRETNCGLSVLSLRYLKPKRIQFVAWLNTGLGKVVHASRDPRETQIANRLGYIGHIVFAPWIGIGVTAHRMLLPDAWRGVTSLPPTFYMLSPPTPPVEDLTLRVLSEGEQQVFVEQWRGLLYRCSPGLPCPAPIPDPSHFAPFTAVLRVDRGTGLPVSLVTMVRAHWAGPGQVAGLRTEVVSQATFLYGGSFSIGFVKN
jgi:hypothetical protein